MKTIIEDNNLIENIELLQDNDYKYIIKAKDNFLSGWGQATGRSHIQLIACKDCKERENIFDYLKSDDSFSCVNWYNIKDIELIKRSVRNKSYTIRNDWKLGL